MLGISNAGAVKKHQIIFELLLKIPEAHPCPGCAFCFFDLPLIQLPYNIAPHRAYFP